MIVKFDNMCSSTMTSGRTNFFGILEFPTLNKRFIADKCYSPSVNYGYLREYRDCLTFLGGFVDSAYFVKNEIEMLSDMELQTFISQLECATEQYDKKMGH